MMMGLEADKLIVRGFLNDALRALSHGLPSRRADQLCDMWVSEKWEEATRDIVRICELVQDYSPAWRERAEAVRVLLANRAAAQKNFFRVNERFVFPDPDEKMSSEEEALWALHINNWDATATTAGREADEMDRQLNGLSKTTLTLEQFLKLWDSRRGVCDE